MKKSIIPFVLLVVFVVSSCDVLEFDDSLNKSPNLPSDPSPTQLIANAMLSLPGLSSSPTGEYRAQYLSKVQYPSETLYPEGGTSFYGWYQGPLINLEVARNNAATENQKAVATILQSYFFWNITDRWGDIPYSQALQGNDKFTPAYDTQEAIYDSLFTALKSAGSQLETSGSLSSDIMYGGDMEKWRKFSNTVRLLMALRLSEVAPQKAQQEFNAALDDGVMASNADNFTFAHLASTNGQNYWYGQIALPPIREWWGLTENLVERMGPVNDPRLPVYGNETRDGGGYVGVTYGEQDDIGTEKYSLLGSGIYAQDAPVYLVTYAEILFAKAEAAERGWIAEDAASNYNMAIRNSIEQWTGSTDGADAFLSQPEIAYDPSNGLEAIINQKYVHLFMHGYQAWAEWRRTGYPDNLVEPQGNAIPMRQSYTSDEALNNTENYEEANQRQFGSKDKNSIYGHVWWDVE